MPEADVVVEVFGEGKTDIGPGEGPRRPTKGVVPILLDRLCGEPASLRVKCRPFQFLQGKGLPQKVHFAKRQAFINRSKAAVFVIDSDGKLAEKRKDLEEGRSRAFPEFPMALGVAHPCIEAWLLVHAGAIRRGLDLSATPKVPAEPESLPAPCQDAARNPKRVLCELAGAGRKDLASAEKDRIANAMNDFALLRQRCPLGFAPFADGVEKQIRPLF